MKVRRCLSGLKARVQADGIDKGRIVESGTFKQLSATEGGRFRELWQKQISALVYLFVRRL